MNATCTSLPILWPMSTVCSGRGICATDTINGSDICICDDGWHGYGEYWDRHDQDCNVSQRTIDALYIINLVLVIIAMMVSSVALRSAYYRWWRTTYQIAPIIMVNDAKPMGMGSGTPPPVSPNPKQPATPATTAATGSPMFQRSPAPVATPVVKQVNHPAHTTSRMRRWCRSLTDHTVRCVFYYWLYGIVTFPFMLMRVIISDSTMARYWPTAIMGAISTTVFWMASCAMALVIFRSSISGISQMNGLAGARRVMHRLTIVAVIATCLGAISAIFQLCGIVAKVDGHTSRQEGLVIGYDVASIGVVGWIVPSFYYYSKQLVAQIDSCIELSARSGRTEPKLEDTKRRVLQIAHSLIVLGLAATPALLIAPLWPWLRTQTAYTAPFQWCIASAAVSSSTRTFIITGSSSSGENVVTQTVATGGGVRVALPSVPNSPTTPVAHHGVTSPLLLNRITIAASSDTAPPSHGNGNNNNNNNGVASSSSSSPLPIPSR